MSSREVQRVGAYRSAWGEGPIWWDDALYYVDIEGHRVLRWTDGGEEEEELIIECGERVGLVVPRSRGGLVIAGDTGFHFLEADATKTFIADPEPDIAENRFNDGKCDPQGRLWAGTISTAKIEGSARLYRLDADGAVHQKYGPVTNSNGICWSLDGTRMYYIDTPTKKVLEFPFDGESGDLGKPKVLVDTSEIEGAPDGMTIDAEGQLWVAFCRGSAVRRFDGASGAEIEALEIPCTGVTAVAFGGPDLKTLFVTTGQFKDPEQGAGYLYAAEVGVAGVPAFPFAG